MKTKRDTLEALVNSLWIGGAEEKTILDAFGFETHEVSYLSVSGENGDYVGNTRDDSLWEMINFDDYDDNQIEEVYKKLSDRFDLGEE